MLRPNGECLEWTLSKSWDGYGQTKAWGRNRRSHRVALELEGIDTSGKLVLHSCDNRLCCNPKHLRVGTQADNMRDMVERKRSNQTGKHNNNSKLTEQEVIKIKDMIKQGYGNKDIARNFCVTPMLISQIRHNRAWTHI